MTTNNLTTDVFDFLTENEDFCSSAFNHQSNYFMQFGPNGSEESYTEILPALNITTDCIERYGGEGEGESYWSVWEFSRGYEKVFVKFDGWYQSYGGQEFDEWFFVEPVQVMVTQYPRRNITAAISW